MGGARFRAMAYTEGYITAAVRARKHLEMAIDLALSLRGSPRTEVAGRVAAALAEHGLTEDDVVRLIARRPASVAAHLAVARTPWISRRRVRLSLMQNPGTPPAVAVPLIAQDGANLGLIQLSDRETADFDDRDWDRIPVDRQWEASGYEGMDGIAWYRLA